MNRTNIPDPDLDNLLKQMLKDDLPPDAEARMNRQFLRLEGALDRNELSPGLDGWLWARGSFRREILAVASAVMIVLGLVMQLSGSQSVLAHSIEQLKVIGSISVGLSSASSMDCVVLKPAAEGGQVSYRVRWRAPGEGRVDRDSAGGAQTFWISNETASVAGPYGGGLRSMPIDTMTSEPVWQPALEFISPRILAKHIEQRYGLMQNGGRSNSGTNEFLIAGWEGGQDIEITVDSQTYLPKVLKKYSNRARNCTMEARFLWNRPIPAQLLIPGTPGAER